MHAKCAMCAVLTHVGLGVAAEMIVGPKRVLFMDEISTGLDSSTTFAIIKYLRDITHMMQYTTAIALLQPAPETYDLFDDIMLIAEGANSLQHRPQYLVCNNAHV